MTRILTNIHLSDIQKEVLAKVKAAPNPQMAWEEIANSADNIDNNFAAARDVLGNLGILTVGEATLEVTDKGESAMQDANLIDEMGELTEEGQQLAGIDRDENPENDQMNTGASPDMGAPEDIGDDMAGAPMESFSLIRSLQERVGELNRMKKFTK